MDFGLSRILGVVAGVVVAKVSALYLQPEAEMAKPVDDIAGYLAPYRKE